VAIDSRRVPGRWFRIRVTIARDAEDEVLGLIALCGSLGSTTGPAGRGRLRCEAWFATREEAARALDRLASSGRGRQDDPRPEPVEDDGWLDASLRHRAPLIAGPLAVLERPLEGPASRGLAGRTTIVIPASRAFGTGEHATTRMCLELLTDRVLPGSRVLDLGTGSGILAIAAAKLGAARVLAIDSDPTALEIASENVDRNGVRGSVALAAGSWGALGAVAAYDLVLANIHRTALVRGARALCSRIVPGGSAILSGFLRADECRVEGAWVRQGACVEERRRDGEWVAIAAARAGGRR